MTWNYMDGPKIKKRDLKRRPKEQEEVVTVCGHKTWLPSKMILAVFSQSKGNPLPSDAQYSISAVQTVSVLGPFSSIFISSLVYLVFGRVMI